MSQNRSLPPSLPHESYVDLTASPTVKPVCFIQICHAARTLACFEEVLLLLHILWPLYLLTRRQRHLALSGERDEKAKCKFHQGESAPHSRLESRRRIVPWVWRKLRILSPWRPFDIMGNVSLFVYFDSKSLPSFNAYFGPEFWFSGQWFTNCHCWRTWKSSTTLDVIWNGGGAWVIASFLQPSWQFSPLLRAWRTNRHRPL